MGFSIETGISAVTVFVQGLLSFFSPCVLPLVPLYLGYLSGGLNTALGSGQDSGMKGNRIKLFLRVLFFVAGIGGAFFILGLAHRLPEVSSMNRECCLQGSEEY